MSFSVRPFWSHFMGVAVVIAIASAGNTSLQALELPPLPELPTLVKLLAPDPVALAPNSTAAFTLVRSGNTATEVKVDLLIGGSAVNGTDYEALSSPVTIPAGVSAVDILVRPLATAQPSIHNQTVQLQLVTNAHYAVETRKPVTVTIIQELFNHYLPTVAITVPTSGAVVKGPVLVVTAEASDAQDGISSVSFFAGDTLLGVASNAPYSIHWTNSVGAKSYALFAKAVDGIGQVGLSAAVNVTVTNSRASVVLTEPVSGAVVHPGPVTLVATATAPADGGAITEVEFYANGRLVGSVANSPYSFIWPDAAPGRYELEARAVGIFGELGESPSVRLIVSNSAPVVAVTAPQPGTVFSVTNKISFTASAIDGDGTVVRVRFYLDQHLIGESTHAPFSTDWKSPTFGEHLVVARATDNHGVSTSSTAVKFSVTSAAPSVTLTAPLNNSVVTLPAKVSISASVTPGDGSIVKVNFWANRHLIGTATKAPYLIEWVKPTAGQYVIDAHVQDSYGVVSLSPPILITIKSAP